MTTVDRRAVQELIDRVEAKGCAFPETVIGHLRVGLAELPSSNAQAVAWQVRYVKCDEDDRPIGWHPWRKCSKDEFSKYANRAVAGIEYRALCVCSGDT